MSRLVARPRPEPLVIVGDSLLDVDLEGTSDRLSPDGGVPVVDVRGQRQRPGGAGLAAWLAARDRADLVLVTALAPDAAGATLRDLLEERVEVRALPLYGGTVSKTRIAVGRDPLTRLDVGTGRAAHGALPAAVARALDHAGAVLVADYGRGVAAHPALRERLVALSGRIPVVWDPHPRGARPIDGCTLVTPNLAEAQTFSGVADPETAGRQLVAHWQADAVAVTVGERGAVLSEAAVEGGLLLAPPAAAATTSRGRPDTCGAGDQFAVAAAGALLDGADARQAVQAAVVAATRFVRAGGAGTVSVLAGSADEPALLVDLVDGRTDAYALVERVRRGGGRVVATGGCFDLLHPGHVSLLQQARALGDVLVVCLNSDRSVRRAKGPARPVVAEQDRAAVLLGLTAVNAVVVFDEPTPTAMLDRLRPDVWVKGGDYTEADLPEAETVRRHGGEVVLVPVVAGHSTTRMVAASRRGLDDLSPYPLAQEVS